MDRELYSIFEYILKSQGEARGAAVAIYADAWEAAGHPRRAEMFRQYDCPLNATPDELRGWSSTTILMQAVSAGTFRMGACPYDTQAEPTERPQHLVTLTRDFALGVFPVTYRQFATIVEQFPRFFRGGRRSVPDHIPVTEVSWLDAVQFCNILSVLEDRQPFYYRDETGAMVSDWESEGYRLPTEAEWEYACRAGTETIWPWGDDPAGLPDHAWYRDNAWYRLQEVGGLHPNLWGFYDLLGNVEEWGHHSWRDYTEAPVVNPEGTASAPAQFRNDRRMLKGGSWMDEAAVIRPSYRDWEVIPNTKRSIGFRIARTLSAHFGKSFDQ